MKTHACYQLTTDTHSPDLLQICTSGTNHIHSPLPVEVPVRAPIRVQELSPENLIQRPINLHIQLHTSYELPHLPCPAILVEKDDHRPCRPQDLRLTVDGEVSIELKVPPWNTIATLRILHYLLPHGTIRRQLRSVWKPAGCT